MTLLALLAGVAGAGAALAAASAAGAAAIGRRYPPHGRFVDVDGLAVHVVDVAPDAAGGTAPPVLFVHGASGNLDELRAALGSRLADRRTIWFDRPGHGHSRRGPRAMSSPVEQARIAAGLLDRLGVDRAVVVGHSWGASVAAALAVTRPDKVAGLVFVAPATHPWPGGVTWYYTISTLPLVGRLFAWTLALPVGWLLLRPSAAGVFHPEPMPPAYPEVARIALVLRPETFLANARDVADLKANVAALAPRYGEIAVPTVVVTGDADTVVLPAIHADGLVRDVPGAELVVLPGAGHMPHHTRPEAVVAAIVRVSARAGEGAAVATSPLRAVPESG